MMSSVQHSRSRLMPVVIVAIVALFAPNVADAQRAASTAGGAPAIAAAAPESVGMSAARLARLNAAFKKEIDDKKVPGAVMLITRKGKLVYASALGARDPKGADPMRLDPIFRIYPVTKPLVSVAALIPVADCVGQLTDAP